MSSTKSSPQAHPKEVRLHRHWSPDCWWHLHNFECTPFSTQFVLNILDMFGFNVRWLKWKTRTKKAFMPHRDSTLVRTHTHNLQSLDECHDKAFSRHFQNLKSSSSSNCTSSLKKSGYLAPSSQCKRLNCSDWSSWLDLWSLVLCLLNPSFWGLGKQGPWFHEARLTVCANPLLQSLILQPRFVCLFGWSANDWGYAYMFQACLVRMKFLCASSVLVGAKEPSWQPVQNNKSWMDSQCRHSLNLYTEYCFEMIC